MLFKTETTTNPDRAEKTAWLRLARTENIGPVTFYKLMEGYGSAQKAIEALPHLSRRGGRKTELKAPPAHDIEREIDALHKLGGSFITAVCDAYPLALSTITDAPPVLSYIGDIALAQKSCVGIVGARNASINGMKFTEKLARELGATGQVVVSGLARGIDTAAHKGSLSTGTIAVVAGGIDIIYPPENEKLYQDIKKHGLVFAESPLSQKPFAQSFPRRNRIVSALSAGVVVVEATMRSGSLITARLAGEQGRDVFAVPGHPLDPRADGPNHLIRQGATLVRNAADIMESLNNFSGGMRDIFSVQKEFEIPFTPEENLPENIHDTILSHLSYHGIDIDELLRACHVSVPAMQTALLELELAGRIKRTAGSRISLIE